MYKLADTFIRSLVAQPETGMGYQRVEATLRDNKVKQGIAFNAELLILDEEKQEALRLNPFFNPYSVVLKRSPVSSDGEVRSLRVLLQRGPDDALKQATRALQKKAGPAKDAPKEKTKAGEVFKRFSAYKNDHRVTADGRLLPNTYATTEEDAKNVNTGQEAVARYALPNPEPASYKFTIKPYEDTEIQQGTVEPANGQPGGGVEVIFTTGTQEKTVTGPEKIPDNSDAYQTGPTLDKTADRTPRIRDGVPTR